MTSEKGWKTVSRKKRRGAPIVSCSGLGRETKCETRIEKVRVGS